MRLIIIYYSRTGTNQKLCQELQKALNCDMEQIIDKMDRRGIWNFILAGRDAMLKKLTQIEPLKKELSPYDLVIIGTPLWVGTLPPATRTFLRQNKDLIKRIAVISVSGMGESNRNALSIIEAEGGRKPEPILILSEKDYKQGAYRSKFEDFVRGIQVFQKLKGDLQG